MNENMQTPYFVIHETELKKNIDDFNLALSKLWQNSCLAYSVKTNSLPWILKYLNNQGVYAEVVSDEEYLLAKKCGYLDENIIFNGPIKGKEIFNCAIEKGAFVNIDSKHDVEFLMDCDVKYSDKIGIRINLDPSIFSSEDIEYNEEGFRFGFADKDNELFNVIGTMKRKTSKIGLHLHCNSITRSKDVYKSLSEYAVKLIKKYNLEVSYIDIGGGFFGGVPGKTTPEEYIEVVKAVFESEIDISKTKLIVEPGSAIIGSVVDLVTSVVDIKDTLKSRIVTTDGSRLHIDPLWIKKSYMYSLETLNVKKIDKQIVCGYTCMDHDRLMTLKDDIELVVGDKIIYHRVGAYSMTFGGMFIRYYPDVYVYSDEEYHKIRNRISVQDYYEIHNYEE